MDSIGELLHNRQIQALTVYRFVSRLYFYLPVLVVILLEQGLTLPQAAAVVAAHGVTIMVLKAPLESPKLNAISPSARLAAGEVLKCAGVAGLAVTTLAAPGNIPLLTISQALNGLGFCLTAGTDSGMLYELVRRLGAEEHYRELETRTQSYGFIAFLGSGVIGGVAATHSISTPLILTIPANLLAAACVFGFRVPQRAASEVQGGGESSKVAVAGASTPVAAGSEARGRHLRENWWLIVLYAVNRGVILTLFVWIMPVALFVTLDVPVSYFGLILGLYTGTGFVAARYSKQITERLGETRMLLLWIPACLIAGILLLMLDVPALYVVIPVIIGLPAAFVRPLSYAAIAQRAPSHRGEVISAAETLLGIINAGLVVMSAVIAQTWGRGPLVVLLALVALAAATAWAGNRKPVTVTVTVTQAGAPIDA